MHTNQTSALTALVAAGNGAPADAGKMADHRLILAVPNHSIPEARTLGDDRAFFRMSGDDAISVLAGAGAEFGTDAENWFAPRNALEVDARFRQIIPYVVLRCDGKFLTYTRGDAGGESRLHAKISMGFGGHVDVPDAVSGDDGFDLKATLENSVERELDEEIPGITILSREWAGLLLDNTNDVGRVHVGLIGVFDIETVPKKSGEAEIANLALMSLEELRGVKGRLENWSQVLIENL